MPTFDLTSEPWIPVIADGTTSLVSLRDALVRAGEFSGLALDSPPETVAVLRQALLPVWIDALGPPRDSKEWAKRWSGDIDTAAIQSYLDEHASRFDLFHAERPFAQVGGLRTAKNETKPVSLLLASAATGNNVPLFSARTEADPPALTPAEAARALLAAHCWDTAAIKSGAAGDDNVKAGKTTGNPTGPLGGLGVVVPMGHTLLETLMLNTPTMRNGLEPGDRPQWRSEDSAGPQWRPREAGGLLDLLTWQSRRIRLVPEASTPIVVRQVVLAAGDRLTPLPQYEPHTAWRTVDKPRADQAPVRPVRHVPGRAAWRGLEPLLATRTDRGEKYSSSHSLRQVDELTVEEVIPSDLPLRVLAVGVEYGNQSAVVEDVFADVTPLPLAALDPDSEARELVDRMVRQSDALYQVANHLGDDLRFAEGASEKLPWDKGQRLGDILMYRLGPTARRALAGLQRDPHQAERAEEAWITAAKRHAMELAATALNATTPAAFLGHKHGDYEHRLNIAEAKFRAALRKIFGDEPS